VARQTALFLIGELVLDRERKQPLRAFARHGGSRNVEQNFPERCRKEGCDESGHHSLRGVHVRSERAARRALAGVTTRLFGRSSREKQAFELAAAHNTPPAASASV
jgi:hypothetical protein